MDLRAAMALSGLGRWALCGSASGATKQPGEYNWIYGLILDASGIDALIADRPSACR